MLPDQTDLNLDKSKTWTTDEVQHLVAREVMKHRMDDLQSKIAGLEANMASMFAEVKATLQTIQNSISRGSDSLKECRQELEEDIAQQYATKLELEKLEGKFNVFAAKIIAGTSVAMVIIQFVFQLWGK